MSGEFYADIEELNLRLDITQDYWRTEDDHEFSYDKLSLFINELAWHLLPKFEEQAWVPLFSARIEVLDGERVVTKGFTVRITLLAEGTTV